ncbi:hypothetical protein [Rhizobacter fulvus]
MTIQSSTFALAAALALCVAAPVALAQTAPAKKAAPTKSTPKKAAAPKKVVEPPPPPAAAGPEQIDAAERVFYGVYDCEFKQTIDIVASAKFPAYVEVKHGKADYLMKPVLSSTGAIRLEDVRGETLMVQIVNKSMLLNVKTAQRIVDDCVSPKQRELIEAARVAKAAAAASGAAPAAGNMLSGPAPTPTPPAPATSSASDAASAPAMTTAPASAPLK